MKEGSSDEEASHLLLPFSPDDVKQAVFDIAEDKAPGPDGYSSGFFNRSNEGGSGLLYYRKTTKTDQLHDFDSNTKDKIISPCQTAFIPGRSIGDNIMLAQELFSGYNQMRLPPRCALKVDIRKAYDTVEWDFLLAVLQLFGFPTKFTRWIEECVSTTSFSIGLNGKPHGFFTGARGLRQGDPLSPYLFVLVMEALHLGFLQRIEQDMQFTYHLKCESSKVFQLGFADDLLLFCRADFDSIRVFKEGLEWFAELSGLWLNVQKSHLIISRSAQELKDQMLEILEFQEGHLPMRYLGLPLISSRLSISDCQPLISKIDARITGWEGISLSYAGRVQIIKSVLSTLSLYWASAFILPKKVIKEIEKRLRNFLWKGTTSSGYAKVAWKDVCQPADEGGLGFKDISTLNRALMRKKLCDIIQCDRTSIWVQWLYQDRLQDTSIWTVREHGGSWGWRKILRLRPFLRSIVDYQIGNGGRFFVWQDPWHHLGPLIERFPRGPCHLRLEESAKLSSVISAGEWQWPTITDFECLEITHNLPLILGGEDRVIWRCDEGQPTTQTLYRLFDPPEPKLGWSSLLSGSLKIPRHSFILWLAILGKLPTMDKSWLSHLGYAYCALRELRNLIHIYSFDADLVVSASLRFADGFVFTGPTGTGQHILNGRHGNGESVHEHCIDYGVSLGLREKPFDDHMLYYTITLVNEIYIYPKKEGSYSTKDCYNNVVGMGGVIPMAKDASLVSIQGNPKLGFGASKDANGGRSTIYSPAAFNLDEFLGLANKV
ncbi:UNVERIFIED_CONTAM: hypothetical protein Sindi_0922500 [Sesamum indicum]